MDRQYRWRLLEYQHQEQSLAYALYQWDKDSDLRRELRKATGLENEVSQISTQWGQILRVMDWVHHLSRHQGWDEAPDLSGLALLRGAREGTVTFRCVEFAHMLQQVLAAFAFPARVISLRRPGSEEGLGKSHVVVDVWSTDHGKWVVLDPQLNLFYTSLDGAVLSAWEVHDRILRRRFDEVKMSEETAIRTNHTPMEAHDNLDYATFEVPEGFERQEAWDSLPDHGDADSFIRFWEEYYYQLVFRRSYSLLRPKVRSNDDSRTDLFYYDAQTVPPLVFQRMPQAVTFTTDRSKIAVPINGVDLQWDSMNASRYLHLILRNSMPWFDHYGVTVNGKQWITVDSEFTVALQAGENSITIVPVNDYCRVGHRAVLRIWVN